MSIIQAYPYHFLCLSIYLTLQGMISPMCILIKNKIFFGRAPSTLGARCNINRIIHTHMFLKYIFTTILFLFLSVTLSPISIFFQPNFFTTSCIPSLHLSATHSRQMAPTISVSLHASSSQPVQEHEDDKQTDRQTYRQTDIQTDRHTDRQTYRKTGSQYRSMRMTDRCSWLFEYLPLLISFVRSSFNRWSDIWSKYI